MLAETALQTDLCVVGGGMAGVCAALAAARNGARVVLLQDRSLLGGNASSEIRMHMVGASCSGKRPGARESGLIDELRVEDAVRNPQRSPHLFDVLLYDKVISEPNITLLLDTACAGCQVDESEQGRRITQVRALRHSTEDAFTIRAPFFVDCSGDSRLGLEAGADWRMGREARGEFDESLAPEQADSHTLGSTILFTARRHDRPMPFVAPAWARRFSEADLRLRSHSELDFGYWWIEWGGHLDTVKDNAAIRHELLRIVLGAWDHVKNGCSRRPEIARETYDKAVEGLAAFAHQPDPANWALDWIGFLPGKRESRRLLGPFILTQHDIQAGRILADQVAYGGWWLDLHPPLGVDAPDTFPCAHHPAPHLYTIPLRALFSRNVDNLFFAGRNISASHVAFSSTRVMATCAVMGQAVGAAAAVGLERGLARAAELAEPPHIGVIQQRLLRDGAFLIGLTHADPADKARLAVVTASDETSDGAASQVLNGLTRATRPELHPDLPLATNRWTSGALPAWIELRWPSPQTLSEIHLTFDTGFQRELTLTMSDAYAATMIRGPQPETVRDYRLEFSGPSGGVVETLSVRGNYLGRRVHRLAEPVLASALRLVVEATHGAPEARLFEIRAY
ncbi:MAG: FAD-dependent oxidoreductase [Chloroflexota bacterium]